MSKNKFDKYRPHPWHGIPVGKKPPVLVNTYIEITPADGIKYEIDKETGYLKVDRPQKNSSLPPALYGFVPRTYCADRVAALSKSADRGDGDPLDICVLSERLVSKSDIIVPARVIGGFRLIDRGEADDKIVAVVESDPYWAEVHDIKDLPKLLLDRLTHYFLTYKLQPEFSGGGKDGKAPKAVKPPQTSIENVYGLNEAKKVVTAAIADYEDNY
jgi:inorganic pyrophosphatase